MRMYIFTKRKENYMKRICKTLLLAAVIMALLAATAFAADFTHCADALKDLGLFSGSDKGYELDRAPTRLEAGVMLVRLLGQEENAKALADNYTAPFTDVKPWAYGYVQYLYDNGLSKGQGGGLFGSDSPCTAQQYATFLLRALGYTDSGATPDFTYANALTFATHKGVADELNCDQSNFLRGNLAAMSYTALSVSPKTGEADLLTKLTADGAIADAKGYDKKFEALRAFDAASLKANDADAMAFKMNMDMGMSVAGETIAMKADVDAKAVVDTENFDNTKMSMTMKMEAEGETMNANCYFANGAMYMDMAGEKVKMDFPLQEMVGELMAGTSTGAGSKTPLCMVKDATASTANGETTYTVSCSPETISSLIEEVMSNSGIMDAAISSAMTEAGVSAGNAEMEAMMNELLKSIQLTADKMDIAVTLKGEDVTGMAFDMGMSMSVVGETMKMTLKANITDIVTEGVTVTLPTDLNTYVDMTAAEG